MELGHRKMTEGKNPSPTTVEAEKKFKSWGRGPAPGKLLHGRSRLKKKS